MPKQRSYTRAQSVASFMTRVKIGHQTECWPWTGCTYNCGYGSFLWRGKMRGANRVAWEIANGQDVPDGLDICHSCDNPLCVNPWHLFAATASENMRDMHRKGRSPLVCLKADQVREIRKLLAADSRRGVQQVLGRKYGVSPAVISGIKTGRNYWTVQDEPETTV